MGNNTEKTQQLIDFAYSLGFELVGCCKTSPMMTFEKFVQWLDDFKIGQPDGLRGMAYLRKNLDVRQNPDSVLQGVTSAVIVGLSYQKVNPNANDDLPVGFDVPPGVGLVAEYARGVDYHLVFAFLLKKLKYFHQQLFPNAHCRAIVDTVPFPEREYAMRVGFGSIGKNGMLINCFLGSRFFIGGLLSTSNLESYQEPKENKPLCGECRQCVDACPTKALSQGCFDISKCLNYWTIESNDNHFPQEIREKIGQRFFGCDVCQKVCPWNAKKSDDHPTVPKQVLVSSEMPASIDEQLSRGLMSLKLFENMTEEEFKQIFRKTCFFRLGLKKVLRNLKQMAHE